MKDASLIERLVHFRDLATRCGNRTDHPLNAVQLVDEAIEQITRMAEAVVDLDKWIDDRDGVDPFSDITVDVANDILKKVKK